MEAKIVKLLKNRTAPEKAREEVSDIPIAHVRIRSEFLMAVRGGTAGDVVRHVYNPVVAGLDRPNPVRVCIRTRT